MLVLRALIDSERFEGHIVLVNQKDPLIDNPKPDDSLDYGIVGKLLMKIRQPNGNYKVKVKGLIRAKIEEYFQEEPFLLRKNDTITNYRS